ncbi:hypothetical protein JS756_13550 [Streptomyces actuosus]|uniref:Serine/threonine protein kinase n=1 Tax=Streptomyces actuosus TaxID=1885 RepID=A0ABS2VPT0_STRAS|nr:hypothetical protein [Streptomyces actuosus]
MAESAQAPDEPAQGSTSPPDADRGSAETPAEPAVAPARPADLPAAPAEAPAAPGQGPAARRPRRRGRTVLLIGAAAVLGLVAGTCTGYLVQADREPTRLPPLSQPLLRQSGGKAPAPLSAAQDRKVRTDGDLRTLLLKKPRGAKDVDWLPGSDGWIDLADHAEQYKKPAEMFGELVGREYRRGAVTGWNAGGNRTVEIELIQYRQQESTAAADMNASGQYWAEHEDHIDSWPIPGTGSGTAYVRTRPDTKPGYLPLYSARAFAYRGDIVMEIWVHDTEPLHKADILDLAERQMERL